MKWNCWPRALRRLAAMQTKADVEVFILDEVFAKLPTPPFTTGEKKADAGNVYAHVWQQAMNGELAMAA
jgi:type I restriction enzyme, R subunit